MAKKLRVKDIERLENTSVAALSGAAAVDYAVLDGICVCTYCSVTNLAQLPGSW